MSETKIEIDRDRSRDRERMAKIRKAFGLASRSSIELGLLIAGLDLDKN